MEQELLSLSKAARRLGVTIGWLKQEARSGRIPCLPAGVNRYLFNMESVNRALCKRASRIPSAGGANE